MISVHMSVPKKKVIRRLVERTFQQERLGFEAYVWAAHRITGLLLLIFILFHLSTLSTIFRGEVAYNRILSFMESPVMKVAEIMLLWVVLFHSLNGCRLILFNLFPTINHKRFAYSVSIISLILASLSIPFMIWM